MYAVQWGQFLNIIADQSGFSDISNAPDVPEVGAWCSPLKYSLSVELPVVGYARLPLPSVDNSLMPELVWVPALPQPTGRIVEGEVRCLCGGWPGRARSLRRGRLSLSVRWVRVAPSGTLLTVCQTMRNRWGITAFP